MARKHEADIQLLERAATTDTDTSVRITMPKLAAGMVGRWPSNDLVVNPEPLL